MNDLFLFPTAARRHPDVEAWLAGQTSDLGTLARHWFGAMRKGE